MRSPIDILKERLKEIHDAHIMCMANGNNRDKKTLVKHMEEFEKAIHCLGINNKYEIKAEPIKPTLTRKQLKPEKVKKERKVYKALIRRKKRGKDIVLKSGERIKRLSIKDYMY